LGNRDLKAFTDAEVAVGFNAAPLDRKVAQGHALFASIAPMDDRVDLDLRTVLSADPSMHALHDPAPPTIFADDREL
jgi:hypothetical protein